MADGFDPSVLRNLPLAFYQSPALCYPLWIQLEDPAEHVIVKHCVNLDGYNVMAMSIPVDYMIDSAVCFHNSQFRKTDAPQAKCRELNLFMDFVDSCHKESKKMIHGDSQTPGMLLTYTMVENDQREHVYHLFILYINQTLIWNPQTYLRLRMESNQRILSASKMNAIMYNHHAFRGGGHGGDGGGGGNNGFSNYNTNSWYGRSNGQGGGGGGGAPGNAAGAGNEKKPFVPFGQGGGGDQLSRDRKMHHRPFHLQIYDHNDFARMAQLKNDIPYTETSFLTRPIFDDNLVAENVLHPYRVFSLEMALMKMPCASKKFTCLAEYVAEIQPSSGAESYNYAFNGAAIKSYRHPFPEKSYWMPEVFYDVDMYHLFRLPNPRRDATIQLSKDLQLIKKHRADINDNPDIDPQLVEMFQREEMCAKQNGTQSHHFDDDQGGGEGQDRYNSAYTSGPLVSASNIVFPHGFSLPAHYETRIIPNGVVYEPTSNDTSHLSLHRSQPFTAVSLHGDGNRSGGGGGGWLSGEQLVMNDSDARMEGETECNEFGSNADEHHHHHHDTHPSNNDDASGFDALVDVQNEPGYQQVDAPSATADTGTNAGTGTAVMGDIASKQVNPNFISPEMEHAPVRVLTNFLAILDDIRVMKRIYPLLFTLPLSPFELKQFLLTRGSVGYHFDERENEDDVDLQLKINELYQQRIDDEINKLQLSSNFSAREIRDKRREMLDEYIRAGTERFETSMFTTNGTGSRYWHAVVRWGKNLMARTNGYILRDYPLTKKLTNVGILGEELYHHVTTREMVYYDSFVHKLMYKGYVIALSVNDKDRESCIHALCHGQHGASKSHLIKGIMKSSVPVGELFTMMTLRAETVGGNFDGAMKYHDELNYDLMGAGGNNGRPEHSEAERAFKLRLSMGMERIREMIRDANQQRVEQEITRKANETNFMNTNARKSQMTPEFLDRVHPMLFMDFDRPGRNIARLICAEQNKELRRLEYEHDERKKLIHFLQYTLDQMITVKLYPEVKCSFAKKVFPIILERANEAGFERTHSARSLKRLMTANRTHTKKRSILLRFFSDISLVRDKKFSLHHFKYLVPDLDDYDPSIAALTFGMFQEYSDPVKSQLLRTIRDVILCSELKTLNESTYEAICAARDRDEQMRLGLAPMGLDIRRGAAKAGGLMQPVMSELSSILAKTSMRQTPAPAASSAAAAGAAAAGAAAAGAAAAAAPASGSRQKNRTPLNNGRVSTTPHTPTQHLCDSVRVESDDDPTGAPTSTMPPSALHDMNRLLSRVPTGEGEHVAMQHGRFQQVMPVMHQPLQSYQRASGRAASALLNPSEAHAIVEQNIRAHDTQTTVPVPPRNTNATLARIDELDNDNDAIAEVADADELEMEDNMTHTPRSEAHHRAADLMFTTLANGVSQASTSTPPSDVRSTGSNLVHLRSLANERKRALQSTHAPSSGRMRSSVELNTSDPDAPKHRTDLSDWYYRNPVTRAIDDRYVFIAIEGKKEMEEKTGLRIAEFAKKIKNKQHGHIRHDDIFDVLRELEKQKIPHRDKNGVVTGYISALEHREGGVCMSRELLLNANEDALKKIVEDVYTEMNVLPIDCMYDCDMSDRSPFVLSFMRIHGGTLKCPNKLYPTKQDIKELNPEGYKQFEQIHIPIVTESLNYHPTICKQHILSTIGLDKNIQQASIFHGQYGTLNDAPHELIVFTNWINELSLSPERCMQELIMPEHMIIKILVDRANIKYDAWLETQKAQLQSKQALRLSRIENGETENHASNGNDIDDEKKQADETTAELVQRMRPCTYDTVVANIRQSEAMMREIRRTNYVQQQEIKDYKKRIAQGTMSPDEQKSSLEKIQMLSQQTQAQNTTTSCTSDELNRFYEDKQNGFDRSLMIVNGEFVVPS